MQFGSGFKVGDLVTPAAYLVTCTAVGRSPVLVKAKITLSGYGHAQCPVGEHLYLHEPAGRAFDALADYGFMDFLDLVQVQLACKHYHIRIGRIKPQRLHVGNTQLGGDVDFHTEGAGIDYGGHVRCNHSGNARILCSLQRRPHVIKIFLVKDDVQGKIGFKSVFPAYGAYFGKIGQSEIVCRMRTHVQAVNSEIHGIRAALDCSPKRFVTPGRSHYFQRLLIHSQTYLFLLNKDSI